MRKFSLLVGTLGGALAGYILSNDTLRQQLSKAKDAEAAAKALGKHLAKDGKKIAKEVKTFVESDDVQKNLKKARIYAAKKFDEAQKSVQEMMKSSKSSTSGSSSKSGKGKMGNVKMKRKRV